MAKKTKEVNETAAPGVPRPEGNRLCLTDAQCTVLLKAYRDFGYPGLKFQHVRSAANNLAEGKKPATVIEHMMLGDLEKLEEASVGA